jgi:hypothetical protein
MRVAEAIWGGLVMLLILLAESGVTDKDLIGFCGVEVWA